MNLLFILADQFRADCLGHLGNPIIQTPNLDRLAGQGASFRHCFNQTAPCGPSRMSIFTSRYMCSTRAINNFTPLRDAEENFAFALRGAGWTPGLIGYNDYTIDPELLPQTDARRKTLRYDNVLPGFERVYYHEYDSDDYFAWLRSKSYPEEWLTHAAIHQPQVPAGGPGNHLPQHFPARYRSQDSECHYLTDRALAYLGQHRTPAERGWALSLNYIKPHPPNICCEPYHRLYDPATMPPAKRRREELESAHHPTIRRLAAGDLQDELHLREYQACYYGMISEVDDNIGRIFNLLETTGQWDETLIIFSSDHGEHLGDHYLTGKGHFYDGGMRIPCIVRDPSAAADATRGQVHDHLVESIDLAPTALEAMGVDIPPRFQGRSLLPMLRGEDTYQPKHSIFYEFDYRRQGMASDNAEGRPTDPDRHLLWVMRDLCYKYVHFADDIVPPLLFDLTVDAGEFNNVAGQPRYQQAELTCCHRLLRWRMLNEDQRMETWSAQYR